MKKARAILLVILLISLCGCTANNKAEHTSDEISEITSAESYENSQESSSSIHVQTSGDFTYIEKEDGIILFSYIGTNPHVVIPEEINGKPVSFIRGDAFERHTEILSVEIPNTVTTIGHGAFFHCTSLETVILPDHLESIWSAAFAECEKLSQIEFPESLQEIQAGAFDHCKSLKQIVIPKNVHTIGLSAFSDSGLESI